jgi:poly(hydroxyalkanoate) granule-associated protein
MAEAPRRREEGTRSSRQGKPRRKPAGAPKAGGRVPAAKPRRPSARASTTNPLRSRTRPAAGADAPRGKSPVRSRTAGPRRPAPTASRDGAAWRNGNGWLELVRSMIQAPVGAGRAQAERLVGELVRTGNLGQREAERLVTEMRGVSERAEGRAQSAADGLDRFIESRIEVVLNRVNIPSRSDVERLKRSVEILTNKVETLLSRHERIGP